MKQINWFPLCEMYSELKIQKLTSTWELSLCIFRKARHFQSSTLIQSLQELLTEIPSLISTVSFTGQRRLINDLTSCIEVACDHAIVTSIPAPFPDSKGTIA